MADTFETRIAIVHHMAEMLLNMTDPDDVKGIPDEELIGDFKVMATHLLGCLDFKVLETDENGLTTATLRLADINDYMDKIIGE
jgi:hypothetical protein